MSLLGQRPRPALPQEPDDLPDMLVPFDDDAPAYVLPAWAHFLAECVGVLLRKIWLYVCAPMGAMCLLVLLATCGINRP